MSIRRPVSGTLETGILKMRRVVKIFTLGPFLKRLLLPMPGNTCLQ